MTETAEEKIFIFDYKSQGPSWLKRTVRLIKSAPLPPTSIKNFLGNVFASALVFFSLGLALPLIFKIKDLSYQIEQEILAEQFKRDIQAKIDTGVIKPPSDEPIELKSNTKAFNHINDYVIGSGVLWYRRRKGLEGAVEKPGTWKPFYFDQDNAAIVPVSLTVDGANLCVIDNQRNVHYRKVLREARGKNKNHPNTYQMDNPKIKRHLPKDFQVTENYIAIDKSEKSNWKPKWFSFPVLNRIVNFFTASRLKVNGQFANSHRGRYNDAYLDANGYKHLALVGVTTGYELEKDGTEILKRDPWAPVWSKIHLYFPETEEYAYVIKKIDASASCIMAIGYKVHRKTGEGSLTILTNFCDMDTLGYNPILYYAYQTEQTSAVRIIEKDLRVLPDRVADENWVTHPLPSDESAEFYNQITVIQKHGEERKLRVAAKRGGTLGYYSKDLSPGTPWVFNEYALVETQEPLQRISLEKIDVSAVKKPPRSYAGFFKNKVPITVNHFGERAYHSDVTLIGLDDKKYSLALHRRWGLKTYLGFKGDYYELVIPKETNIEGESARLFGQKKVIPVHVSVMKKNDEELIRIDPQLHW